MCVATSIIVETFFENTFRTFPGPDLILICGFSAGNGWWWVPVVGPMAGGVAGAVIYFLMIELHHPELEKNLEDDNSIRDKYEFSTVN